MNYIHGDGHIHIDKSVRNIDTDKASEYLLYIHKNTLYAARKISDLTDWKTLFSRAWEGSLFINQNLKQVLEILQPQLSKIDQMVKNKIVSIVESKRGKLPGLTFTAQIGVKLPGDEKIALTNFLLKNGRFSALKIALGANLEDYKPEFPKVTEKLRYFVRDETAEKITKEFKVGPNLAKTGKYVNDHPNYIPDSLKRDLAKVRLFVGDKKKYQSDSRQQLLGRFDVLATPCKMDYDSNWNKSDQKKREFYLHHAAALNIGDEKNPIDFKEYSKNGVLDEKKYIQDMGKIVSNILKAQKESGIKQSVWNPFGMGAFLKHLGNWDKSYDLKKLKDLKIKLAEQFLENASNFKDMKIHIALPDGDNLIAFERALQNLKKKNKTPLVKIHVNVDATELAQTLANQSRDGLKVSLVNAANRNLIGNHWSQDKAFHAIDENIHRRSSLAASCALLINSGTLLKQRNPNDMQERVGKLGGQVVELKP